MPNEILATPEARQALARIRSEHGNVIFHVTGGCCDAHSPLCLPAGELRLGARDVLIGAFDGVAFYEMENSADECCCSATYVLDVMPGTGVGFSIAPGPGLRFTLRELPASSNARQAPDETQTATGTSA